MARRTSSGPVLSGLTLPGQRLVQMQPCVASTIWLRSG